MGTSIEVMAWRTVWADLLVLDLGKEREAREEKRRGDLREEEAIGEAEGARLVKVAAIDA
jgi:hypothetical protein